MIETVTLREVASILKCHEQTVRKLVHEGKLHGRKFGRAWAFLASDVEKLFRQCDNESWHFTKEAQHIGPVSQLRTEQELDALLARQTAVSIPFISGLSLNGMRHHLSVADKFCVD